MSEQTTPVDNSSEACVSRIRFALNILGDAIETLVGRGCLCNAKMWTNDGESILVRDITGEIDVWAYEVKAIKPKENPDE